MFLVTLFILQSASNLAITDPQQSVIEEENQVERVHFELETAYSMKQLDLTIMI